MDGDAAPETRRMSRGRIAAWIIIALLTLLLILAATGYRGPSAKTAKTALASVLAALVILAALVLVAIAALRRSALLVGLGVVVLLGGVSTISASLGLPDEMQGATPALDEFFGLIGKLLALLARLLDLIPE